MRVAMSSSERVTAALSHREGDRVPLLLPTILQGARVLGMGIERYFSRAEQVVEGQLRLRQRYRGDAVFGFLYAAQEIEAWGGTTVFRDDGPPNAGEPPLRAADLDTVQAPWPQDCSTLLRVLRVIEQLAERLAGEAPVVGMLLSPLSLPVLQLGFERYLDLIYEEPARFERLLRVNEEFCVAWGEAQLAAGAAALVYADPVGSPSILPPALYRRHGFPAACRVHARLAGALVTSHASGRSLSILGDLARTGTLGVQASVHEDLRVLKQACSGRLVVMGNLNAIEMRSWSQAQARARVLEAILKAAPGGGFVLTDNHGEIPWQVPDEVLLAIADAVAEWGRYPIMAR